MSDMVQIPREVLEKIEWCCGISFDQCPICRREIIDGHFNSCPIGIALKPTEVEQESPVAVPVEHEMVYDGEKYRTEPCSGRGMGVCNGCDVEVACDGGLITDELKRGMCLGLMNPDMKERIWKKVVE